MNQDDREKRIAERKSLIRQQEAAKQKRDRPEPTLKPKSERGKIMRHIPKSDEQILREATQDINREDAEKAAAKVEAKRENPLEAARAAEISHHFTKQATDERAQTRKPRPTFAEREAQLRSRFMKNDQANEQDKAKDRGIQSRFLGDEKWE